MTSCLLPVGVRTAGVGRGRGGGPAVGGAVGHVDASRGGVHGLRGLRGVQRLPRRLPGGRPLRTIGVSGTESGLRTARSIAMANAYGELRSSTREVAMTFRMTNAERAQLQREAIEAGMSQQQLFELRMFGSAKPRGRDGRPRKQRQSTGQGVLPQTA